MFKNKKNFIIIALLIIIILAILVIVYSKIMNKENISQVLEVITSIEYNLEDEYSEWKNEEVSYIKLDDNNTSLKGNGATIKNNVVTITKGGIFHISGTLTEGRIIINTSDKEDVRLILDNVNITCITSAPIYVENSKKLIISLEEGSNNYITDGKNYTYDDIENEEPNATIFSKDDLVINGKGTLNITANFNDGIATKDDLKIMEGNINIKSAGDGIRGKNYVAIKDGTFFINAYKDGIKSTNSVDKGKGYIIIENGSFNIESTQDGIEAETTLLIEDGVFDILTGGGSAVSSNNNSNWGKWGMQIGNQQTSTTDVTSAKAIKATSDITIQSGEFNIDCSDDSIHSNGTIIINGGIFNIASGDDGIHADTKIIINLANINISKSYEGIESSEVEINDGQINVYSSDDGINIAGGNDNSSIMGRPGQNTMSANTNQNLNINGGIIKVFAAGDGLDSNGNIYINGGETYVDGPTDNGNGSLDYGGICEVNSGILIAAGSSGMLQTASTSSKQYCVSIVFSATQNANTILKISNSKGEEIISYTPSKNYQAILICSPKLTKGETYTTYSNETEVSTFTVSNIITNVGNSKGNNMIMNFPGGMQKQR